MSVKITIDGRTVEVPEGLNILLAAKHAGIDIPHFCYHPLLSIAGNCRMCIVEVEGIPKPCVACGTIVKDGMEIRTETDTVKKIRHGVMEFLLINHPLDCPICDQAGECRLQEYYMLYDCKPSRFVEKKVTKEKAISLGDTIVLDRERCIQCTRCVRFFEEIVGDAQLGVRHRSDHAEIITFDGKPLDSIYSGNIADSCPVGALTFKDFRFKCRVWFLKATESICPGCSRGCNVEIHESKDVIYRLKARMNPEVNQAWMCDIGRLVYKRYQGNSRITKPMVSDSNLEVVTWDNALNDLARSLQKFSGQDAVNMVGVASSELTNEDAKAFKDLLGSLGAKETFIDQGQDTPGFEDDLLIKADRSPNTAGLKELGITKPVEELEELVKSGNIDVLMVAAGHKGKIDNIIGSILDKVKLVVVFAYADGELVKVSDIVLPVSAWPELNGSFTNFEGKTQEIKAALPAKGDALPLEEVVSKIKSKLERKSVAVA